MATSSEHHGRQPLGFAVDMTPAKRPGPIMLQGHFGRVEKLSPAHTASLWEAVAGHDAIWTYMPYGPFDEAASFAAWIDEFATMDDPYAYAIVDTEEGAIGMVTLLNIRPSMRVIEVGHVLYAPSLQRTPLGTEAQYLLARYVFETLGYRRYEWKCDSLNAASRNAAQRYGFTSEGIFRQHMIRKGHNRDTAWFAMLDSEWPDRKANFERWLAPENFTADGEQIASLRTLSGASP